MSALLTLALALAPQDARAQSATDDATRRAPAEDAAEGPGADPTADAAPAASPTAAFAAPTTQIWPLSNGDELLLVEDHRAPLVEIKIEFPAGRLMPWYREIDAEIAFENLMYDTEGALRARADALAIDIRMFGGNNVSSIEVSCLREDLDAALALVRDVLATEDIDPEELKRGKKGQKIDWEGNLKDPGFRLEQEIARLMFADPEDPRRRGWEEPPEYQTDVAALLAARDQLVRLPGRTIGFAGDLTPEEALAAAEGLLPEAAQETPGEMEVFYGATNERPADHAATMENLTQVYFGYVREGVTWQEEDYPAFLLANHALAGHFYSRLYVALRHEGGETYGVSARNKHTHEPWLYKIDTFTRSDNADATEAKLMEAVALFREEGISQDELDVAKSSLKGKELFQQQAPSQILGETTFERAWGLPTGFNADVMERISAMDLETVNAFIAEFYAPEGWTMVRLEPAE